MKKSLLHLLALILLLLSLAPARAQDPDTAATAAARQDAEERYKHLNAAVEDLITAQAAMQKRISELTSALAETREEMARNSGKNTTREELHSLAEKVKEIEKNREADKKLILEEIKKLGKRPPGLAAQVNSPPAERAEKGYEYVVQAGDNFSAIAAAYQKEGIKVTVEMIQKANPKLESSKLKIGQKIFIPQP